MSLALTNYKKKITAHIHPRESPENNPIRLTLSAFLLTSRTKKKLQI